MKKICYLGPEGSYSHIITKQVMAEQDCQLVPLKNFAEIIQQTKETPETIGVLPLENSITSNIHENIEALFSNELHIFREAFLRIKLHLIGLQDATIEEIKTVYSYEKALAQCSNFLTEHNITPIATQSTAEGKKIILEKQDKSIGAIGSRELANDSQLRILEENIGNERYNITRFVFVTKDKTETNEKKNKASVTFIVPHEPGSLAKLLTEIAKQKLNMTKIESDPIPGTNWEYHFWIDIENPNGELSGEQLTTLFTNHTQSYKILGIYPSGNMFES